MPVELHRLHPANDSLRQNSISEATTNPPAALLATEGCHPKEAIAFQILRDHSAPPICSQL
jgi:hypothetical protein